MPMFPIGNIPIIGEQDRMEKRLQELDEKLKMANDKLLILGNGINGLRAVNQRLVDRLGFLVSQQKSKRLRINRKELETFIGTAAANLVEYYDKECDDIVLYLREDETDKEKTVKTKKDAKRAKRKTN